MVTTLITAPSDTSLTIQEGAPEPNGVPVSTIVAIESIVDDTSLNKPGYGNVVVSPTEVQSNKPS